MFDECVKDLEVIRATICSNEQKLELRSTVSIVARLRRLTFEKDHVVKLGQA